MSFETVNYQIAENVATIAFNRPESLNALSRELVGDLTLAIKKASDDKVRAVILTGNGRAFCSGGDLVEMLTMQKKGITTSEPLLAMHAAIRLIRNTPIPFIAAVNGVCAGAGTNFALACDLVFADENAPSKAIKTAPPSNQAKTSFAELLLCEISTGTGGYIRI